jgi:hypothetical protein
MTMTICDVCSPWAARTTEQLRTRLRSLHRNPELEFNRCPKCRDTEWATTNCFIETRDLKRRRWWQPWRDEWHE